MTRDRIESTAPQLADPAMNLIANALGDGAAAATVLSTTDARRLYFGYAGRSLMLEMTGALPWSITEYGAPALALLLDSRTFFVWKRNVLGTSVTGYVLYDSNVSERLTFDPTSVVSWVVPAPPSAAASFLSSNG